MNQFDFLKPYVQGFRQDRKTDYKLINQLVDKKPFLASNQFCYFVDYQKFAIVHTSSGIENVLGIKPQEFTVEKYFDTIHPDDVSEVRAVACAGFDWCKTHPFVPLETTLTIKYRVQHANGYYLPVQRQTVILDRSEKNNVLASVGICTAYEAKEVDTKVKYSFTGPGSEGFHMPEIPKNPDVKFTPRELTVLAFLVKGLSSKAISEKLSISKSTVDDHRRNMLHKTGLRNSVELIVFGIKNGLV